MGPTEGARAQETAEAWQEEASEAVPADPLPVVPQAKRRVGRPCAVCTHPRRVDIDAMILAGEPYKTIQRAFENSGPCDSAIRNHHLKCLMGENGLVERHREAVEAQIVERVGTKVVDRVERLYERLDGLLDRAEAMCEGAELVDCMAQAGAIRATAALAGQIRGALELMAKLRGELSEITVNVVASPDWRKLQAIILATVCPVCLEALSERLAELTDHGAEA